MDGEDGKVGEWGRGKELPRGGQHKGPEFSGELGFRMSSTLTSFFRKDMGMSPVEYRNSTGDCGGEEGGEGDRDKRITIYYDSKHN